MLTRGEACALPTHHCQHEKRHLFYKKRHFSVCHNSTSHCKKKQISTRLNCFLQRFNVRFFMILHFSLTEMQQHILLVDKVDNIGVTFQVPRIFWSGLSGYDRKKKWEAEIVSGDPNYQWPKGKHPPGAFQMQVKENTGELRTYAISETQFKGYAGDNCKLITAAEQARRDSHLSQSLQGSQDTASSSSTPATPQTPAQCLLCLRPAEQRSRVYDHFLKLNPGLFSCRVCGQKVTNHATSTSALFSHMNPKHYSLWVQLAMYSPRHKVVQDAQGSLQYNMPFARSLVHHYHLTKWVVSALATIAPTVESATLRAFVGGLCAGYTPACRGTVRKILSVAKAMMEKKLQQMLFEAKEKWGQPAIALQTDLWTSTVQHNAYGAVNASFFTGDLHFVHVLLDVNVFSEDSHTGVAIASWLGAVLRRKDLSSDDISVITPDNAANMKKAVGLMDLNFRGWYAHTLQRYVQYGIGNAGNPADDDPINTVVAVIAKCKKLVAYVNNSTKVHRKLTQAAHKHGTSNFSLKQVSYSSVQSFNRLLCIA